ncbi:MAG TPA: CoA transferase, partial [Acidimicrobiales bacterium]|nr:CoA transferase [Acidimicrobiales bacterium]
DHPTLAPMGTFRTTDGYLNLAAPGERLFNRMCHALNAEHLLEDERFSSNASRTVNKDALKEELQLILEQKGRADWVQLLSGVGVPVGPVNSVAEALSDPQVEHLGTVVSIPHPLRGTVSVLRSPIRLSSSEPAPKTASPTPGQHTDAILAELGIPQDEIDRLRADGVV